MSNLSSSGTSDVYNNETENITNYERQSTPHEHAGELLTEIEDHMEDEMTDMTDEGMIMVFPKMKSMAESDISCHGRKNHRT